MKKSSDFHILIVDDEKLNIELASVYLKDEGYKLSFATNGKSAIGSVLSKNIDLILLDINMPVTDGFEVCKILKADAKTKDIPVIFLTAQTTIEYISRAFEVGGVDYINKPFNGVELKARVKTHLQSMNYLQEIKMKQSKLAQISITDPLTKLHNTLYFDSQIKNYQTKNENFWIIYIKINRFEKLNTLYGFYSANKIIRVFSTLLNLTAYKNSKVARLYGVSFGILLKDYQKQEIKKLYESIATALATDKEIGKIISISTVLYHEKEHITSISHIYKKLQESISDINENNKKYLIVD